MEFFIHREGIDYGPFSADEVKSQLRAGSILPTDYIWHEGQSDWALVSSLEEFAGHRPPPPRLPLAQTIRLRP